MYKRVVLALDLEGVNFVVGEPYQGLDWGTEQWRVACKQAVLEINAAAEALFDAGVEKIGFWDTHGGEFEGLDPRMEIICQRYEPVMGFLKDAYDCICYFGYHAMEGTLGGVLAHTMSSVQVQYFKLNGKYIGEVDMHAYVAASYGVASRFFAAGDLACKQAQKAIAGIVPVVTKKEISRNKAVFRDNSELLAEIKEKVVQAVQTEVAPVELPMPAVIEKSFKRTEDAAELYQMLLADGMEVAYPEDEFMGKDAHTLVGTLRKIEDIAKYY